MRPFWGRFMRHATGVGLVLAVTGYLLAQGFLMTNRMYSGGAYNADNERVLWQTPVVMAAFGILLCGGIELLTEMFRRPAAVKVSNPPSSDPAA
jgi:hypothetical protein